MASGVDDFSAEFLDDLEAHVAEGLMQCGAILVSTYMINVSKSFPPASVEGEYPRWRTGTGRSAATYEPSTVGGVRAADFVVTVGLRAPGIHMAWLEVSLGRLGFLATLETIEDRLASILTRPMPGE